MLNISLQTRKLEKAVAVSGIATPRPHTGPEILEIRKVHFEVRKMPFLTPQKKALKSQLNSLLGAIFETFSDFFRLFNWLFKAFFWGVKNGIFWTSKCTFRISRISGPVWGRGVAILGFLQRFPRKLLGKSRERFQKTFPEPKKTLWVTAGVLYGAGAETLIFVTGTTGRYPKLFVSRQKTKVSGGYPGNQEKIGVSVSGAEIQTSAVDTRTAVWVSTSEKFSKIVLGKTRNFSRMFRGVSAPALCKNPAVIEL